MKLVIHRLIALMLLTSCCLSFGQATEGCLTEDPTNKQRSQYLSNTNHVPSSQYCLQIYVHVIRTSSGTGGQSTAAVQEAISILRDDFSPYEIYFYWENDHIDYINDNQYYYNPASANVFTINGHVDGVDIYLFSDDNPVLGGYAGPYGSTAFFVSGSYWNSPFYSLITSSIMTHEMGHILDLRHTHAGCNELADGSNCNDQFIGDGICDTPADPNMYFNVDNNCIWSGPGVQLNSCWLSLPNPLGLPTVDLVETYDPDPRNIMAYTRPTCMTLFKQGQVDRMFDAIANIPFISNLQSDCPSGFCPFTLEINDDVTQSGVPDIQEADISVLATNTIENGTSAAYDAGEFVTLGTGFHAKAGSNFRAYIDGCSIFQPPKGKRDASSNDKAQEVTGQLSIYPNPANDIVHLTHSYLNIQSYNLYDIHGRIVSEEGIIKSTKHIINVSKFRKGIYILNITLEDNTFITKQLIIN